MKRVKLLIVLLFLSTLLFANPYKSKVSLVIIDAGHGGKDPGAISSNIYEKEIVLDVALKLKSELMGHVDLLLTRDDDYYITLQERCDAANSQEFDLIGFPIFISIHANAAENESAEGYEIYIKPESVNLSFISQTTSNALIHLYAPYNNKELNDYVNSANKSLANKIENKLKAAFSSLKNRGVKEQNLHLLTNCFMPAVLIEIGFMTNKDELERLLDDSWQTKLAHSICQAILSL